MVILDPATPVQAYGVIACFSLPVAVETARFLLAAFDLARLAWPVSWVLAACAGECEVDIDVGVDVCLTNSQSCSSSWARAHHLSSVVACYRIATRVVGSSSSDARGTESIQTRGVDWMWMGLCGSRHQISVDVLHTVPVGNLEGISRTTAGEDAATDSDLDDKPGSRSEVDRHQ